MARLAVPPTDDEKHAYLSRPQHRWVFVVALLAFLGVGFSLFGLATRSSWTLLLLAPVALFTAEKMLTLRTSTWRRRVTLPDHRATVELWAPQQYPSIDIFLPNAGEDLAVLENTFRYVDRIQWPGELSVLALDDVGRPEVEALADHFGFRYLARPDHAYKKAGNLQYALDRSAGEHVLILDADFVPRPDLLLELSPYLDDPTTGIVQSPQFFDCDTGLRWLQRAAGATQEIFFRLIQPSRDAVGAAICVGTSALYRREALSAIGGFPQLRHSEDVVTGVRMARKGWQVQYVPVVVSKGTCPADLDSFIEQQYRWCEGSMALMTDAGFHDDPTMVRTQRASFWAGFLYYVSTAVQVVVAPLPLLIMVLFFPQDITNANLLPLLGVLLLWLVVLPVISYRGWRPEVVRVELIYGWAYLFCLADLVEGKVHEWIPTGRRSRRSPLATRVRRTMAGYLILTQSLTVAGLLAGSLRFGLDQYWGTILLAALSGYVLVPVLLLAISRREA